ncbi:MAG: ribbon-helix-helix domain-containing protein [Gammaproteobacteria bacterium]|nr:ribbon-helix-helix domain-containing protein [Gammaproteobacteria bacterium]MBU1725378.1 ribbon-helix-helix domain-containing protein [Gammaproteobacteria bacterium]MBU2006115.1 ribbon-helix-helix domain-containing protein [Gammaproteobacteria bacterium]
MLELLHATYRNNQMNMPIQANLPENLLMKAQQLVQAGWVSNLDDLLADALRRYLESHSEELAEKFIREDVQWGLYGKH